MKIILSLLLLFLAAADWSPAQQQFTPYPATQLELIGAAPGQPANLTANYSGPAGSTTFFYWVLATHVRGQSALTGAVQVNQVGVLSAGNNIALSWPRVAGALNYSLLRTTAASGPVGTCACLVTTTTANTALDVGAALTNFTVVSVASVTASISIDNASEAQPFLNTRLAGSDFRIPLVGSFTAGSNAAFDSRGNLVDGAAAIPTSACEGNLPIPIATCHNGSACAPSAPFISDGIVETQLFAGNIRFVAARFNNAQADALYFTWLIPSCFTSGTTNITLDVVWSNDGNVGAAEFDISTLCVADGELLTGAFTAVNVLTTDSSTATPNLQFGGQITLDATGCAAGETQFIKMARQVADPYNGDVYMFRWDINWSE